MQQDTLRLFTSASMNITWELVHLFSQVGINFQLQIHVGPVLAIADQTSVDLSLGLVGLSSGLIKA